ncbi:MAG TPA: hypothetical protein VN457_05280 [Chlamydiales bacterium]|nr:hypothetical protein [Chlamydiales bacterium]
MNFSVYVNKALGQKINKFVKELDTTRNTIFREAIELWIAQHQKSKWPPGFFDFTAVKDLPDFKAMTKGMKSLSKDPLQ